MKRHLSAVACGLASMMAYAGTCGADTVTDWDTKATAAASPAAVGEREVTIVDLAMFDAVNSIERRYQPYLQQLPTTRPISADAAAASAAASALAALHPEAAASFKAALAEYLARLDAAPEALSNGVRLGEAAALKILEARANDGATGVDSYRPKTKPGQYLNDNPDTERDATWQPLDNTPMHPEYPCAHCIESGAARVALESLGQPLPELALTSATAGGVTHSWSNLDDFTTEVANARIWAGFHYRFSTRVGTALGRQVGEYVATTIMQPVNRTAQR